MRNYFTFGQFDSRDFGVYISGEGTYNAPARVYDVISVPGRNGDLLIDRGKFENISVKYPAFIAGDNFRSNLAAFRSAMLSGSGYARLTDTYHPDEFRLAYYGDPIEMTARKQNNGAEFDIVFNCDPRRFLLSGETPVTYPPGDEAKNLLPYPYYQSTHTSEGVTWTDKGDGTITATGTKTSSRYYTSSYVLQNSFSGLEDSVEYILSGCPTGGSDNTYWLTIDVPAGLPLASDYGDGATFIYDSSKTYRVRACIARRGDCNLTFRPMIRKATDPAGWEPYYDGITNIYNPTLFASNPLIRVTGSGTVGIGDNTITVGSGYSYVDIDSETQNCYCGTQNANAIVSFSTGEFPTLTPGVTGITVGSGITSVQITPRWYRV